MKLHVSRDVVFDELSTWYGVGKVVEESVDDNGNARNFKKCKIGFTDIEWA